ncbi:xanthine dehydrogenase family protein molybdopterin-binding subunit [Sphingomonas sp. UYP23]
MTKVDRRTVVAATLTTIALVGPARAITRTATVKKVKSASQDAKIGPIGKPVSRIDGPLKVRGKATFAAEFAMDRMLYASLVFSTISKGRIETLDTAQATKAAGVIAVMTHHNAPRMKPMLMMMGPGETNPKAGGGDSLAVLQDDRIHWNGQPIAVVLATSQEQADYAASLVGARYVAEPAVTTFAAAKAKPTETGEAMGQKLLVKVGDAESALKAAAVSVDETYRTPNQSHNAIEPHAATVAWKGDELIVHDASQAVTHTAATLAVMFGIEETKVHVTSPFVGGGFGGKMLWQHQVLAAAAAKLTDRPVRIALSREGVYRVIGGRSMTEQRVAIGAGKDGQFSAIIHTGTSTTTKRTKLAEAFMMAAMSSYTATSFSLDNQLAFMDVIANTQMRAPGGAVGTYALECAVDELADALRLDPIELRLRNMPEKNPISGTAFSSHNGDVAWRAGAKRFGWSKRNSVPGSTRDGEWMVGMGCAASSHPYVRMPGGAARLTLTRDGKARLEVAAHEMGMGTATVQTQVIAERLGLPIDNVTFAYGDSAFPGLVLAAGSQQTASMAATVLAVQTALVTALLKLVDSTSPLAGLAADQVSVQDAGLMKLDEPTRRESYKAILGRAGRAEISVEAESPPPTEMQQWSMHSQGGMFCEVRVNAITGEVRITRFLGSFDCGRVLNPKTAASQLRGGIIMGLGMALMEETQFDGRSGRIVNPSLAEYHVPVHMDVPEIDVMWTDIPDPHAPLGVHGIGELGITGTSAAVANAIYNATGKRIRDLPITLDKLM